MKKKIKENRFLNPDDGDDDVIYNIALRKLIIDSEYSIRKLAAKTKMSRITIKLFYEGKKFLTGENLDRILEALPLEYAKKYQFYLSETHQDMKKFFFDNKKFFEDEAKKIKEMNLKNIYSEE